ncbi:MAG: HlyD family type I secretion periplasmic adaptor subunit [Pseudomonadota bacterium]|nr:HlyD family type I secretion periplasmic adaptor subunit [Pseudomonadota bacterium]
MKWVTGFSGKPSIATMMSPLALERGRSPGLSSGILVIGSLFVAACIGWGAVTHVNELTIAPVQLRPTGFVHSVQHLEGGQVAEILAVEGQLVETGMPLVRLQRVQANADLDQFETRKASLAMRIERLSALIENRAADFKPWKGRFAAIAKHEQAAFESARAERDEVRRSLVSKVDQQRAETNSTRDQVGSLERQLAILNEQLAMRADLVKQGFVSRSQHLALQREAEKTNEALLLARGGMMAADAALNEANIKLNEHTSSFRNRLSEDRAKATEEFVEVAAGSPKQEDRIDRLTVRAPAAGVIQELVTKSVGQVVRPGELIASIVPMNGDMVAEVRIQPQEIGHIRSGARAEIQVTTFDAVRFGKIPGTVRQISATTFYGQEGEPYYKAVIGLDRNFFAFSGQKHLVMPGMVVQAEILTGSKTLMAYLLKPLYQNYSTAFSER